MVLLQALGFLLAIATCWATEALDPPFSIQQVSAETLVLSLLGILSVLWTRKTVNRIKTLEGFIVMCANCKSVRVDGAWVRIEQFMGEGAEVTFSHGICPTCSEVLYPEIERPVSRSRSP